MGLLAGSNALYLSDKWVNVERSLPNVHTTLLRRWTSQQSPVPSGLPLFVHHLNKTYAGLTLGQRLCLWTDPISTYFHY